MLSIYKDAVDYSIELEDFLDKTVSETITTSDKLLIGYYKPINAVYVELSTANTNSSNVVLKYYNGATFVATDLKDKSYGLTESGYWTWDRNLEDEAKTTINSKELYWYEFTVDSDTSAMVIDGINLVLSDDKILKEFEPVIVNSNYYPSGQNSFIGYTQGATREIIQQFRNQGKGIYNGTEFKDFTVFDLLDFTQLSTASAYLVLSNIFLNYSDNTEDKYYQKYLNYRDKYNNALNVYFLSIDSNDDGKEDTVEVGGIQHNLIRRI